ncbi:MAG: T9SS type A sorting domain-containing protein, partial [Flavobacteriales bacterium]|nr:T9SS type A sorting domain-containing protein [Flavobacteriales bacterium]
CTVDEFCIWVDGELPTCYPVTSFDASGDYFTLYLNLPDTWYYYYYTLDDGSVSGTFAYYNGYCGDEFCSNLDSDAYDAGCQDYLGPDVPVADFYFYYSGDCMVTDICIAADGVGFDCYDLTADFLYSGDYTSFFLFSENTLYDYYYVLDDGSISPIFTYFNGECAGTECDDAYVYLAPDCWGSEVSWDITDAFGNLIYTAAEGTYSDGLPTGTGEWVSALCLDPGCYYFNIYDAFGDGMAGAQYIECDVDGYYYMTDGVGNILFTMPTASYGYGTSHFFCISEGGCDNLSGFFTEGECDFTGVDPILPWDFDFVFDGDCIVQEFCISENGGAYTCYDVSGFALVSGEGVVYTIGTPNTNYEVYYTLSDGTVSSSFFFTTGSCDAEFTICDCDGTVHTGGVLSWLGDGFADDGTYQWEGQYVNFNCSTWGYDCGDIADAPSDDPYGVCSGNLPPANGCIDDPLCETYTFYLTTDCYPDETGFNVYDEFGNIVAYIEPGALIDTYTTYTWSLCLPEGCYTFELTDAFGDGLEGIGNGCTADGDFWYYDPDGNLAFVLDDPNFGDFLTTEECVVLPYTCTNLGLELYQEPCGDFDGSLEPIIGLTFSFDGDCVVTELCWSEDGGAYTCQDVTEFGWSDGDSGILSPTTPDATYYFYYTLDDGSYSPVFIFENGNCDNEPVICDCNGTQHTIGVLAWLGDGFADDGGYTWLGQFVDFNCSTWGYDCGDIAGTPDLDPYNVCGGGLPPNNGCDIEEEVLGCTDPDALNYNPLATLEDGSCLYDTFAGCTDETACNYNPVAVEDDGSCEYVSCAGCTDNEALNFDPTATIDDGSCIYDDIEGCTDEEALNYNPLANVDDGSCEYSCTFPELVFDSFCEEGDEDNFYITIYVGDLGNGAPYTLSNTYDDQQVTLNFSGSINMGPFPVDASVVIQVVSNTLDGCFITSPVLNEDCSTGIISGCTDILATNYYPSATVDDGSCIYDFQICDCDGVPFSPDERFRLGDGNADTGAGSSPNFNCQAWGWDCGDIAGTPDEDPYGVCDGNVPEELIATAIGCPVGVYDIEGFSGYSIYPNPNNGTFNILNSTNESDVEIRIYDATGRLAFSQVAYIPQRSVMSIATGNLSYGTYTLELRNRNFTEHHKLVIE